MCIDNQHNKSINAKYPAQLRAGLILIKNYKMKLYHYVLAFFFGVLAFGSCANDEPSVEGELIVSVSDLSIKQQGETKTIHIKSNVNWTIQSSESWCVVTPADAGAGTAAVKVSAPENTITDDRMATLLIVAGKAQQEILVTQVKKDLLILKQSVYEKNPDGGELNMELQTSGDYEINIQGDWITKKDLKSLIDKTEIFTVQLNVSYLAREGTITFTLNEITEVATIKQQGVDVSIPADKTGVESTASELAAKMTFGWNIGNTLEVPGSEIGWGNPKVNKALIDGVKAAGFNAIRIPCAWDSYIEDPSTFKIKESWLARVKEVVDYCVDNDMYVILNIHWDGGWLEEHPLYEFQVEVNKKQHALWQQIAVNFRNYDEHLLFAGTNEVHFDYGTPTAENIEVQQSYVQTFIDAVRSTGGKNSYRNLVVQSYNTDINQAIEYHTMPSDKVDNRLFMEVHYYDPYDFTLQSDAGFKTQWGKGTGDISNWGQEDHLEKQFQKVKTKYIDNNIPVIIGEYGVMLRSNLTGDALTKHVASRNYYLGSVSDVAVEKGIITFYWDSGYTGDGGSGLFNRSNGEQVYPDAISAIINGISK